MANMLSSFRNPRIMLAFLYDVFVAASSFWVALALRFETFNYTLYPTVELEKFFLISLILLVSSFISNGLYRGVWRFSSTYDLIRVIKASAVGVVLSLVACFFVNRLVGVPRSMFPIQFLLLVMGLGGGRFLYRFLKDQTVMRARLGGHDDDVKKVLIVGAGRAGEKLVRDIYATPAMKLKVIGFVDDDRTKKNALIHNIKVFGDQTLIPSLVETYSVDKIFIAIPSANGEEVKKLVSYCKQTKAEIKILPKMDHLLSNQVEISLLRNLKIEDLLGREQVTLDTAHLNAMIKDKIVLVTGAGGSIGSELCFQIAKFQPQLIVMADSCELFMYELEMKFKEEHIDVSFYPKILDVRNAIKVDALFEEYKPNLVFHAAAYKHVPMMEYNPSEAIETNVKGTKIVAEAALKYGVDILRTLWAPQNVLLRWLSLKFLNVLKEKNFTLSLFRFVLEMFLEVMEVLSLYLKDKSKTAAILPLLTRISSVISCPFQKLLSLFFKQDRWERAERFSFLIWESRLRLSILPAK
jgi:FlaA1/EpsC-like NDP-sugar epimerase